MLTDFTCICSNFLFIVIAMSFAPSKRMLSESAPSSKSRKVQKVWSEIFDNVNITDEQLKKDVVTRFADTFTPREFLRASDDLCNTFCIGYRVERWEDEIRQTISSLQTRIPSLSNMKWDNVPCILL